jgi:hypothetical protein
MSRSGKMERCGRRRHSRDTPGISTSRCSLAAMPPARRRGRRGVPTRRPLNQSMILGPIIHAGLIGARRENSRVAGKRRGRQITAVRQAVDTDTLCVDVGPRGEDPRSGQAVLVFARAKCTPPWCLKEIVAIHDAAALLPNRSARSRRHLRSEVGNSARRGDRIQVAPAVTRPNKCQSVRASAHPATTRGSDRRKKRTPRTYRRCAQRVYFPGGALTRSPARRSPLGNHPQRASATRYLWFCHAG